MTKNSDNTKASESSSSKENSKDNLSTKLQKLGTIVSWFENQEEIDVEKGLEMIKEGAALIKDSKERLSAGGLVGTEKVAQDLIGALIPFKGVPDWKKIVAICEDIKNEEPESLRHMLLAVARGGLKRGDDHSKRCYRVIRCMEQPLFDRSSGWAIFLANCWQIVNGKDS